MDGNSLILWVKALVFGCQKTSDGEITWLEQTTIVNRQFPAKWYHTQRKKKEQPALDLPYYYCKMHMCRATMESFTGVAAVS